VLPDKHLVCAPASGVRCARTWRHLIELGRSRPEQAPALPARGPRLTERASRGFWRSWQSSQRHRAPRLPCLIRPEGTVAAGGGGRAHAAVQVGVQARALMRIASMFGLAGAKPLPRFPRRLLMRINDKSRCITKDRSYGGRKTR